MRRLSALVICVFLIGAFGARAVFADTVSYGGSLTAARRGYAMSSLNDGRALLSGGIVYHVGYAASTDLYTPATHAVSAGPSMNVRRYEHTSTTLADGRVLVAGGFGGSSPNTGDVLASAEIYNPATNSFTLTGSLNIARYAASATLLNDGRVLIVGGVTFSGTFLKSAEVFDPVAGTFTLLSSQISSVAGTPTVTNLNGGTVLVAGGASPFVAPNDVPTADTFDPATNTFTPAGNMPFGRSYHTATKLNDGRVAIIGGFGPESPDPAAQHGVFIYDPATRSFSIAGLTLFTRNRHNAINLGDDRILIIGGDWGTGVVETEIFDVHSGASAVGPSLPESHVDAFAVRYGTTVSILGGYWHTTSDLSETNIIETYTACGSGGTAPVIDVPATVCATAPTTASTTAAGSYRWDVLGGTINGSSSQSSVTFTPSYFATAATLFLTVTDANGCISGAEQTVSVYPGTYLSINSDFVPTCPGGTARASMQGPDVTNILWTITNGTIVGPANGRSVEFVGTGPNVELHVTSTDTNGCAVSTGGSVQASTSPMPAVNFTLQTICPGISTSATADLPWGSYAYSTYAWTISGGTIESGASARTVYFHAAGSGPVTLTCTTFDSTYGCPATATGTLPVTILSPSIDAVPNACTNDGSASVHNSWVYRGFSWSITNGTITSPSNRDSVSYSATSSPVHLSVVVTDSNGCTGTQSVDVPVHLVSAPVITAPATICPNGSGTASVAPPAGGGNWSYVSWQIAHGTFDGPQPYFADGPTVTFHSDGSGQPITLTAHAADTQSCQVQSSATVNFRTIAPPAITAPAKICPNGSGTASVAPPAEGGSWSYVSWQIGHGYFEGSQPYMPNDTTVTFRSDGSGQPITLTVLGVDAQGCQGQSNAATVTFRTIAPPAITAPATICPNGSGTASVAPPAEGGNWSYVSWQIGHGYFEGSQPYMPNDTTVTFRSDGSGQPITLTVLGVDAQGCQGQASTTTVNFRTIAAPAITAPAMICPNGSGTASVAPPAEGGSWSYVSWQIGHGYFEGSQPYMPNDTTVTFRSDGSGQPITLTVLGVDAQGCQGQSSTTTVNFRSIAPPVITAPAAICPNGSGTASVAPPAEGGTWSYISWQIAHGTFDGPQPYFADGPSATFHGDGSGQPITLTVLAVDAQSCQGQSNSTVVAAFPVGAITASGPTTFCAGGSVTLTASAGSSYLWSNGATTQAITVSAGGNYSVTVTDANGCSATSSPAVVTVNANPTATITAGGPTTFCAGGSVTLTASSGSSYLWSTGATTQSIAVSASGNYSVTVTNANGCSATSAPAAVTVNANPNATITADGPTTFCAGGSVTLTASAGASYLWSNGAAAQSITVNAGGSYSVTITAANGCSATSAAAVVTVNANPAPSMTVSNAICTTSSGSAHVYPTNGSTWDWSVTNGTITGVWTATGTADPHGSEITFVPAGAGTMTVTVVEHNSNGCTATDTRTVTVRDPLTTDFTVTPTCPGGVGTVTADGAYDVYSWSIANGSFIGNTASQTVTFRMSSDPAHPTEITFQGYLASNNCLVPATHTVPVATMTAPGIAAGGPTTFCAGGSVTLTASSGTSYLWSTGATTQSITVTASGSYSVTETNAGGCSATSSPTVVTVNANPAATITAGGPTTFCAGGSVTLTASSASSYLWSNGATTQAITVSATGNYSVTVTNANACSATSSPAVITVNANPTATITAGGPTTFCAGGSVTLTASSASSYLWSNGATTQAITVNAGGNYSVTVMNANGCSATSAATVVTVNANPTATITAGGPTMFCAGGSVTLTASSASLYLWSNGATTQAITVNATGNYSVTVTNAAGCSATSAATAVTVNARPAATITPDGPTTFCAGSWVTLTASAGASYLWSNGATTQSTVVIASGDYSVTVWAANGCSSTSSATHVTVNPHPAVTITASGPTTFCGGGSVTLTSSAGASYLWSNGATTQSIIVTAGGNYSVTVTYASGCSQTSPSTTVTVNTAPTTNVSIYGSTTFCEGGSVTLSAWSGYSYLWSNGATTQMITVRDSGSYSVTLTDGNGCSATSTPIAVTVNPSPVPIITAGGATTFCTGGSVTLTASSGSSYLWSNGATTQAITVNAAGNYSVTVTNANGCSATSAATTVTVNANPPAPVITAGGPTTFCTGGTVTLTAPSGASSYWWSVGQTTQSITVSYSGSYTVTVWDANGCSSTSAPTVVTVNPGPVPGISNLGPTTFCAGGSVTLSGSGGTSYHWSTGATTQSITATTSGTYNVVVTDANGCSATSADVVVTVNAKPSPAITAGGPTTFCAGGSVTLTASSGSSYLWSTGATTQAITVSAAGNYSVTVTNAAGCSATSAATAVTVNANPATPTITAGGPTTFCAPGSVTLTASSGSSYLWSTGATTQAITVSASGSYSVTVKNASGCGTTSAPTVVTVKANPQATITPGGPTTFCTGGSVTLTASSGASYHWSTNATTQSITVSASGSYSVTVTNASDCTSTSAVTTVTVNAKPSTPAITAGGPTTFCAGGSVTLTAPAGFTYLWSTGATTQAVSATATGSYTVTVTNASGCSATSAATNVTVNPAPSITAFGPTSQTVLKNATPTNLTVTAGGTGTKTYKWYKGTSGTTTNPISGATSTSYTPPTNSRGTFTYWVRVTIGSCTADSPTATVTVN